MEVRKHTNQYTVGWVAALPIDDAAATAMFDEEHGKPIDFKQQSSDHNSYAWGKIADHNVVIAALPAGVIGIVVAASSSANMAAAFPKIRIGLMVGTGGGIPNPDDDLDIRLGDIVVSQPSGTHGGVLQYDLGKAMEGGGFERKGYLNAPPQTLLTALSRLQRRHERTPSAVPAILAKMLENNPHMATMKSGFFYQGEENDNLFKSAYPHARGRTCARCDVAERVSREKRHSTDPVIHYGLIASGNTVVKDSMFRDSLSDKVGGECLCCETEAAGVMNTFPCLIVRGISNYADSHKNDKWQRYAAAAAAAYAKEFLTTIVGEELEEETTALNLMTNSMYEPRFIE